jgi:hypothetical protein
MIRRMIRPEIAWSMTFRQSLQLVPNYRYSSKSSMSRSNSQQQTHACKVGLKRAALLNDPQWNKVHLIIEGVADSKDQYREQRLLKRNERISV